MIAFSFEAQDPLWLMAVIPLGTHDPFIGARHFRRSISVLGRNDSRAELVCVSLGQLGAEQKNLGGIIEPQQESQQRAGCSICRSNRAVAQIETDQNLANIEKKA